MHKKERTYMIRLTNAHLAEFFSSACATIGQAPDKIKAIFPAASFSLVHCTTDSVLEVATEYFTLSCLIGSDSRCETAYIFINTEEELEIVMNILRYCRRSYRYSCLLKMWMYNGFGIDLRVMDQSFLLAITKIKPLPDDLQKYIDLEFAYERN